MPSFRLRSSADKTPIRSTLLRSTLFVGVAFGLGGCLSGGNDAFYGNGSEAPDVAAVKRVLAGVGVIDAKQKPIEYKPRAPLAVPPTAAELPDPEADATETANLPANWPRDKDAELLALQQSRALTGTAALRAADRGSGRSSIQEVIAGTREGAGADVRPQSNKDRLEEIRGRSNPRLTPTQLRTLKLNKPETAALLDANGKPTRNYLIEPPVEYSTPAATAPLALPEENKDVAPDWLDEMHDNKGHARER